MAETYSSEAVKEFALQKLRLTPDTLGKSREDVPSVISAIGGLQYGGHKIELFNRFKNFKAEWFDYWYEKHALIEGHVLRGALRIATVDEYPYYFKATRTVASRRKYQKCPASQSRNHLTALNFISSTGPYTPSEFAKQFSAKYTQLKGVSKKLLYDLYNYGKVARMGRKNQKPLFHALEKLPYKLDLSHPSEKKAKAWLFQKCLSTFGPFSPKDVAHWIGWNLTETKETLKELLEQEKVVAVKVNDCSETLYARVEDLPELDSIEKNLPEHSQVKILFNDDALLLGCYRRLKQRFGYNWRYPQFSEGIVWKAAILYGRELIGEAIVDMYARSATLTVKKLLLRKEYAVKNVLRKITDEFARHAEFENKNLSTVAPTAIHQTWQRFY